MKRCWKDWLRKAGIRALRTVAQTALAAIGTSAVISEINWLMVGSTSLLAGVLSLLTSLAGIPEECPEEIEAAGKLSQTDKSPAEYPGGAILAVSAIRRTDRRPWRRCRCRRRQRR